MHLIHARGKVAARVVGCLDVPVAHDVDHKLPAFAAARVGGPQGAHAVQPKRGGSRRARLAACTTQARPHTRTTRCSGATASCRPPANPMRCRCCCAGQQCTQLARAASHYAPRLLNVQQCVLLATTAPGAAADAYADHRGVVAHGVEIRVRRHVALAGLHQQAGGCAWGSVCTQWAAPCGVLRATVSCTRTPGA